MLEVERYRIRTVREARKEGYEQMPEFFTHPLALDRLGEMMLRMERKLSDLFLHEQMDMSVLKKYRSILQYSFILVQENFGYCLWSRRIPAHSRN